MAADELTETADPIHHLISFHGRVRLLLVQLDRMAAGELAEAEVRAEAERALAFLAGPLRHHDVEEEAFFVPALLDSDGISEELRTALKNLHRQHAALEAEVGRLRLALDEAASSASTRLLQERLPEVRRTLLEHLSWEELEMFPLARRALRGDQLAELARRLALRSS